MKKQNATKKIAHPEIRLIGYARVSTLEQRLDLQIDALKAAGVRPEDIYVEKTSAVSKKREQLDLAIKALQPGDTLLVWRLDRIARNMRDLYKRIDQIYEADADFLSITERFDFKTATGKLILGFLGLMADFERQLTIERTKAGMKAMAARGEYVGAPRKMTDAKIKDAKRMLREPYASVPKVAEKLDVSVASIYAYFTVKRREDGVIATLKR